MPPQHSIEQGTSGDVPLTRFQGFLQLQSVLGNPNDDPPETKHKRHNIWNVVIASEPTHKSTKIVDN